MRKLCRWAWLLLCLSACSGGGDDDTGGGSLPALSSSDIPAYVEGDSNTEVLLRLHLSAAANGHVTVDYASSAGSDATAQAGSDYIAQAGTAQIPAGTLFTDIGVTIIGDQLAEPSEFFYLDLSNISSNAQLLTSQIKITLVDDDARRLNDTGITFCRSASSVNAACADAAAGTATYPGQDAESGRDVSAADDSDGRAGFAFIKLNAEGEPLANPAASYADSPWDCLEDTTTGLVWEVKSDAADLGDRDDMYTWYQDNDQLNAGWAGNPGNAPSCFGYDMAMPASYCNTQAYVARINAAGYCGSQAWRLPSIEELRTIVDYGVPGHIDGDYFVYNQIAEYWSATPLAADRTRARVLGFADALGGLGHKGQARYIRLVRDAN